MGSASYEARVLLARVSQQLRRWASESRTGGWSTHQVDAQLGLAGTIDEAMEALEWLDDHLNDQGSPAVAHRVDVVRTALSSRGTAALPEGARWKDRAGQWGANEGESGDALYLTEGGEKVRYYSTGTHIVRERVAMDGNWHAGALPVDVVRAVLAKAESDG